MGTKQPGRLIVGRGRELAELQAVLDGTIAGRGEAVLVTGEAGIGKTRLCQAAGERARATGMAVAWASCWQSPSVPAFWPWRQALGQLAPGSEALALMGGSPGAPGGPGGPGGLSGEPDLARSRLFEAVEATLDGAGQRPTVVVIDDLQWADAASLRLLGLLAPRLHTMTLSVLASVRREGPPPGGGLEAVLAELARHGRHLHLGGLRPTDVGILVGALVGSDPGPAAVAALHRHTGGNPLFATELVRLLDARGKLDGLAVPSGEGTVLPVPDTLRGVLAGRLGQLSGPARATLDVAAVAGDEFGADLIETVTGASRHDVLGCIGEAVEVGVVHEVGLARYAFSHALLRAAVYDGLGLAARVRLHRQVGEGLETLAARGQNVAPTALAHHFIKAVAGGGAAKAATYARQAGDAAMAGLAYEEAARLFSDARAAIDTDPTAGDAVAVLLALGDAHGAAGNREAARRAYLDAAALARPLGRADAVAWAALGLGRGSGIEVGLFDQTQLDLLREARAGLTPAPGIEPRPQLDPVGARVLRARVTARLSVAMSLDAPLVDRLALSEEAVALARRGRSTAERAALGAALAAHCDAIAGPADAERRVDESSEIVALAAALGDGPTELLGRRLRLVARLELGDMAAVDAEIDAFGRLAARLRQPLYDWYVPLWRGMRALMQGRIADAERHRQETADLGARAHSDNAYILALSLQLFIFWETGRAAEARDLIPFAARTDLLAVWEHVAMALIHAGQGATTEARSRLDQVFPHGLESAPVDSEWLAVLAQIAGTVGVVGHHPVAAWVYERMLPHRHLFPVDGIGAVCHGSAERHLGVLAAALGRRADAAEHFERAAEANQRAGAALLVARTFRDAALALEDAAFRNEARRAYRHLGIPAMAPGVPPPIVGPAPEHNRFRRQGDGWAVTWQGRTVQLRHVKGMADLARLLARPGSEIAAAELVAGAAGTAVVAATADLGEVLDDRARAAYRRRLAALQAELDEADAAGDAARSGRATAERDALLAQLSAAAGVGGRRRRAGGAGERARTAATWRLRDAIGRIEAVHPDLGRHLRRSVRTGTYCAYDPPEPVAWEV